MNVCSRIVLGVCLLAAPVCAQGTEVYFSPFEDAEARALALLDAAQTSVDVAQYNIRNERFFTKLSELKARGVRVRIVVDAKNAEKPWNTLDDAFVAAGFDLVRYRNTGHAYAIMHHKFTVIDGQTVLTGSYNWNDTAQVVNDENMIVLRDATLAAAYAAEFAELRGAPEQGPQAASALGAVRFSPEDRVRDDVLRELRAAQRTIRVAMFSFKDTTVARALRDAAQRGVAVTLLTEKKQADTTNADETVGHGGARVIVGANTSSAFSAMHQKFAVIDDAVVITGACNWTYTAFTHSNEDVLVLRDAALAARYTQAFGSLVRRYAPTGWQAADYGLARSEGGLNLIVDMPRTQPGETVVIVGDHPALGAWDVRRAVPLRTSDGMFPRWGGAVRLPAGAQVRWKAVVRRADGTHRWEIGSDRTLTTDASGADAVMTTAFRDLVRVSVGAKHATLPPGAELRLVGAHVLLGDWDPTLGLPLTPVTTGGVTSSDTFQDTLDLLGRERVRCKLVVVEPDGTTTWESGYDRVLRVHDRDAPQAIDLGAFRP